MGKKILDEASFVPVPSGGDIIDRLSGLESSPLSSEQTAGLEQSSLPEPPPAGARLPEQSGLQKGIPSADTQESVPPQPEKLTYRKDGLFHVYSTGSGDTFMEYRLGGAKPLFVTSLRVNIRASNGKTSYYDSIDLYSARSRSSFSGGVMRNLSTELARVEQDLVLILEHLERERDSSLLKRPERENRRLSEAERELGLELLRDPKLFDRIVDDLSELGYVGEELNKQLLYLCATSRKMSDPISVMILSQSASGKSYLVECVRRLMPPEDVVAVTSLSDQALNYIDDLTHKFLILGEAVHGEVIEHQIREMLSGKELSRLVTIKDPETGKMQSRIVRTPVIVSSVMGSTNYKVNPENASRCFMINADESREQTIRIQVSQRNKYSLEKLKTGGQRQDKIIAQHRCAQRLLEKRNIVNDFASFLDFPTSLMRMRRDHDRFLDLIACVCFLRQYQKKTEAQGELAFIRCDGEDYRIAYNIMVEGVLASTMAELARGAVDLYEDIRNWIHRQAKKQGLSPVELSFTQRQIREATGLGHTWVKANVRKLVEYEYLELARGGQRSKSYYRLRSDEALARSDLSMIPTPAELNHLGSIQLKRCVSD